MIGNNVKIYPQCYVGNNVKIGNNTTLYPNVTIYYDCIIGNDCTIHSGSIIGADGFGFAPIQDGAFLKIAQIGNVIIENNVEIGALVTVDRATMGSTIIRNGVRLDNHIHIGHNVEVGDNTVMAAQCGIAGSTKIGKNCMFGGQVGIAPHISIANKTFLAAKTGIPGTIREEGQTLIGQPGINPSDFRRAAVHFRNFDKIVKRLEKLEKIIEN
jgi:UDP-3-O-[3-hydroxymyristoyl] glucosamine N-acyltransferase